MAASLMEREIRACIDSFVDDLSALVNAAAIESVQEALGGGAGRKRRGPGRPRKTASKPGKRIRRSSVDLEASAARILSHIKANPGCGVSAISATLRTVPKDLRLPVLNLLEARKLRSTGQRRGMKYYAVGKPLKKPSAKKTAVRSTAKAAG